MTALEFLNKNKSVSCAELARKLDVSSGTVTKMKSAPSLIQSLALDALNEQLKRDNLITLDVTEYFDKHCGNSYFSAWIHFKGESHFIDYLYGYGSFCEDVALKVLESKGLIPSGMRQYELRMDHNITIKTNKSEVLKRDMYNGSEY